MTDPIDPRRPASPERTATDDDVATNDVAVPANGAGDDQPQPPDAVAEAPVEEAPVEEAVSEPEEDTTEPEPVVLEAAPEPEPPADASVGEPAPPGGGELEWQPVYDGDQISWQPVVPSDSDADVWPTADELVSQWEEQPPAEYETPVDYEAEAGADWGVPEDEEGADAAALAPPARRPAPKPRRGGPPPDQRTKNRRMVMVLSVLTGVVVLVGVSAFVISNGITSQTSGGDGGTTPTTAAGATASTLPASEFTSFTDEATGMTVKYPKNWQKIGTPVADIRLTLDGGGSEAMRVRIAPIDTPATVDNIANYKSVTDGIAFADPNNKLVKSQLIQLNGRLAYYYLYTFQDSPTGQQGVHAHYFVFEGHRMFMMTLQAVPVEDFQRLAGVYDQIAESFTVAEERTLVPPTTATPTTSVP